MLSENFVVSMLAVFFLNKYLLQQEHLQKQVYSEQHSAREVLFC
jgi:hypothetical protein